jgi:hypothetical protein
MLMAGEHVMWVSKQMGHRIGHLQHERIHDGFQMMRPKRAIAP